jgi:hypothetical protein
MYMRRPAPRSALPKLKSASRCDLDSAAVLGIYIGPDKWRWGGGGAGTEVGWGRGGRWILCLLADACRVESLS